MEVNAHAENAYQVCCYICLFSQYDVNKELLPKTLPDEPYFQESYLHGTNID